MFDLCRATQALLLPGMYLLDGPAKWRSWVWRGRGRAARGRGKENLGGEEAVDGGRLNGKRER